MLRIQKKIRNFMAVLTLGAALMLAGCESGNNAALTEINGEALAAADDKKNGEGEGAGSDEKKEAGTSGASETDGEQTDSGGEKNGSIFVYVCGQVKKPGVYEMAAESRIFEAVEQVGGLLKDAAPDWLNQAEKVSDGQKIYVPSEEEVKDLEEAGNLQAAGGQTAEAKAAEPGAGGTSDGKVNLNTAGKEELMTLSGIGESRADAIMQYRQENGGFQSAEDIMKVSGIKEGIYEKIKNQITV